MFAQIFRQLLGHAFGKRCHQHALALSGTFVDLGKHIIDLRERRTNFHFRVHEPRRAHHLFNDLSAFFQFVCGRRCRHKDRAAHFALEFVKAKRSVVQRRRQTKPILHERFLSRAVASIHTAQLPHHHVAFVKKHDAVGGQIVDETWRSLSGSKPREVTRIVFDALAKAHLIEHFQVKKRSLLQALRFYELIVSV